MWWVFLGISLIAVPVSARQLPVPAHRTNQAALAPSGESPEERLARARQAYLNNDFAGTIAAARDLLYPEVKLRREEDVLAAHRLLALAYFLSHAEDASEAEFSTLLALQPDFSLDPVMDPSQAIAFFDRIRTRERKRIEELERRRREQAEMAARAEDLRRQESEQRRIREAVEIVRKQMKPVVVVRRSRWVNLVPLGVGQFNNGQPGKGSAFLATQLAFGLTSLGIWSYQMLKYKTGGIDVPGTEYPTQEKLQIAAAVSGSLFWASALWGVIDALVYFQPNTVLGPQAALPDARLVPFLAPGGAGLSLQGAF